MWISKLSQIETNHVKADRSFDHHLFYCGCYQYNKCCAWTLWSQLPSIPQVHFHLLQSVGHGVRIVSKLQGRVTEGRLPGDDVLWTLFWKFSLLAYAAGQLQYNGGSLRKLLTKPLLQVATLTSILIREWQSEIVTLWGMSKVLSQYLHFLPALYESQGKFASVGWFHASSMAS